MRIEPGYSDGHIDGFGRGLIWGVSVATIGYHLFAHLYLTSWGR